MDFANQLRERGLSKLEAIKESALARFRPIVMTTVAMIAGMLPLALALDPGSQAERPLGIVVIGGLSSSLVLTLLLIPIMYLRFAPQHYRPSSVNGETDPDQIELPMPLPATPASEEVRYAPLRCHSRCRRARIGRGGGSRRYASAPSPRLLVYLRIEAERHRSERPRYVGSAHLHRQSSTTPAPLRSTCCARRRIAGWL